MWYIVAVMQWQCPLVVGRGRGPVTILPTVKCEIYSVQYVVCSLQCAASSVQCAVCTAVWQLGIGGICRVTVLH